ncbi:TlpA family protein disulfide reductase [Algibacter miyuki]|uniref:TlpA family protein disulfide reductase n=1 Tax=Algibacter miyuki TaxID=1306933 RepID=A0ABV5GZI8_9FLAO|nr:TlpA disulfide reductase family protein [Algibacter miyuki]MDN3666751.1 TlpA disulfide reductase family protein [Algibacter miyuki]
MKIRNQIVFLLCVLSPVLFFGQIHISNNIKTSSIATSDENALYFVDFWATWCGPCIHVSKYLESLQRQFPDKFYILSLSNETPEVVKKFMTKHQMDLAVALDYEGETFKTHNITSLPYGILFNAEGTKLWEGHPAELKGYTIGGFLVRNNKTISVENFFKLEEYKQEVIVENPVKRRDDFGLLEVAVVPEMNTGIQTTNKNGYLEIEGRLQDIMAYTLRSNKGQVIMPEAVNKYYKMYFEEGSKAIENKEKYISKALKLRRKEYEKKGDALVFQVNNALFWDTEQIDWGINNPKYLIGDSDIQADNVSLKEVAYKLSNLLETPIVFAENFNDENLHDWQIHYKYFEFMASNLEEYGIKVEKKAATYLEYVYNKR